MTSSSPAPLPLVASGVCALGPQHHTPYLLAWWLEQPRGSWVGVGSCKTVGLCSVVGWASLGAPVPLPRVISLRNLSPSGPLVLPVGLSGTLEHSTAAQSNCYQRWARWGREGGEVSGVLPRAASGLLVTRKEGVRDRHRENQRQKWQRGGRHGESRARQNEAKQDGGRGRSDGMRQSDDVRGTESKTEEEGLREGPWEGQRLQSDQHRRGGSTAGSEEIEREKEKGEGETAIKGKSRRRRKCQDSRSWRDLNSGNFSTAGGPEARPPCCCSFRVLGQLRPHWEP